MFSFCGSRGSLSATPGEPPIVYDDIDLTAVLTGAYSILCLITASFSWVHVSLTNVLWFYLALGLFHPIDAQAMNGTVLVI